MKLELTNQIKEEVWSRQKGMCGKCGKKFEEISDSVERDYFLVAQNETTVDLSTDQIVMLCRMCEKDFINHDHFKPKYYNFQYGNFGKYSESEVYNDIKEDIEHCLFLAKEKNDYKDSYIKLKDIDLIIKKLFLEQEHHSELQNLLNTTLATIQKMHYDISHKKTEELDENYHKIKEKVEKAFTASESATDLRQARERLIEIQIQFKDVVLSNEQREELFEKINKAFDILHRRQIEEREKYEMECIENYHNLKGKVEDVVAFSAETDDFRSARERLISVQSEFKGLKLLTDQRNELYSKIQNSFDNLNHRQQDQRDEFEKECEANFAMLKENVDKAISFANTSFEYRQARENLISSQNLIKGMKLKKAQRDELYSTIRVTFDELNKRQSEERDEFEKESTENYTALSTKIDETIEAITLATDFRQSRDTLIAIQNDIKILKLKKEQRNELFSRIRKAFDSLDSRRAKYHEDKKDEKAQKLASILSNLESRISWLEDSINKDKESLEIQNQKIEEVLPSDRAEFIKRDINDKISSINNRISEKEINLNEIKNRINDITNELNQLSKPA